MFWFGGWTVNSIIVMIGLGVFAACGTIWFWNNQFVQPNDYVKIQKPYNPSRSFTIIINAWSSTFGAQTPVELYVTLHPDTDSLIEYLKSGRNFTSEHSGHGLPQQYILFFEGTNCTPRSLILSHDDKYKSIVNCGIIMPFETNDDKLFVYRGHATFTFPVEGDYGIYLDDSTPPSGSITFSEYKGIKIAPLEATLNERNTKLITILTIAGVYLGGISAYLQSRAH